MSDDVPNENTNDENESGGAGGKDSEDSGEAGGSDATDGSGAGVVGSSGAERPRLSRMTNPCSSSLMLTTSLGLAKHNLLEKKQYHYQTMASKNLIPQLNDLCAETL
jgi:hypothetical protein